MDLELGGIEWRDLSKLMIYSVQNGAPKKHAEGIIWASGLSEGKYLAP